MGVVTSGADASSGGGATTALDNLASVAINTALLPGANDGAAIGNVSFNWSDLFLATGAVINYANGNLVITHTSAIITISTGTLKITTPTNTATSVVTIDGSQTLTNKRVNPRVTAITSNATWSPNADTDDMYEITAQAVAATTISNPSGTPVDGQSLLFRMKDNGTARALTWSGTQYRASSNLAFPTTTTLSKTMYVKVIYNSADTKWDLLSVLDGF